MPVPVNIYATTNVSLSTVNDVNQAIGDDLDSQVNFDITTSLRDLDIAYTQADCNDKYWTAQNFEDYCYFEGHLVDGEHFMILTNCNYGGVAYYNLGQSSGQDHGMHYGISTTGTNTSTSFYQNMAIHELAHTLMSGGYGTCPESTSNEHSCGRIDAYGRSSPMMTSYEDENWDICEDNSWFGSHATITTDCTRNRLEEHVDQFNLA